MLFPDVSKRICLPCPVGGMIGSPWATKPSVRWMKWVFDAAEPLGLKPLTMKDWLPILSSLFLFNPPFHFVEDTEKRLVLALITGSNTMPVGSGCQSSMKVPADCGMGEMLV